MQPPPSKEKTSRKDASPPSKAKTAREDAPPSVRSARTPKGKICGINRPRTLLSRLHCGTEHAAQWAREGIEVQRGALPCRTGGHGLDRSRASTAWMQRFLGTTWSTSHIVDRTRGIRPFVIREFLLALLPVAVAPPLLRLTRTERTDDCELRSSPESRELGRASWMPGSREAWNC